MSKTQSKSTLQRAVGAIFLLALIALVAVLLLQPSDQLPESTAKSSKPQQPTISITANNQQKPQQPSDNQGPALVLESITEKNTPKVETITDSVEVISEDLWQSVEQNSQEIKPAKPLLIASAEDAFAKNNPHSQSNTNKPIDPPKQATTPKKETAKPVVNAPKLELIADSEKSTAPARTSTQSAPKPNSNSTQNSAGNWYVQIGAFGNAANAQKLVNQYKQQGYNVRIQKDNNLNRVQIGPFATKKAAEQVQSKTKTPSINPAVIHLP